MNTEQTIEKLEEENKRLREELHKAELEAENRDLTRRINEIRYGNNPATRTSSYYWEPERDSLGNFRITCSTDLDKDHEKRLEQVLQQLFK